MELFFRYKIHYPSLNLVNKGNYIGLYISDEIGGLDIYSQNNSRKRTTYKIFEVAFHTPAEHVINGKRYPVEMQINHRIGTKDSQETSNIL